MTLFDVFSGQTSEPQTASVPTETVTADSFTAQPQSVIEQTNLPESNEHGYQPETDNTAPAPSTDATTQT